MNREPHKYVDLACMVACYLLVACIALMVMAPALVASFLMECLP